MSLLPSATTQHKKRIMLVTGVSGAGKTTALKTLEDIGWEAVDNFPIRLLDRLLNTPPSSGRSDAASPLALGFDSRTRGFEPQALVKSIKKLQADGELEILTLFLDCSGVELARRYSETRRKHPLALDRPAFHGIAQERDLVEPLRRWADYCIDTTDLSANALQLEMRKRFSIQAHKSTSISISSFGYSRGIPHNADLMFDMRFLRNPHWDPLLKPKTGLDSDVSDYVRADPAYDGAMERILSLLIFLLPQYEKSGKAYVNIAFGCTGGRHRSVHSAEQFSKWLRDAGFSLTVNHRDLSSRPTDALEGTPELAKD